MSATATAVVPQTIVVVVDGVGSNLLRGLFVCHDIAFSEKQVIRGKTVARVFRVTASKVDVENFIASYCPPMLKDIVIR